MRPFESDVKQDEGEREREGNLAQLTREDLSELGVRSIGHRLAILRAREKVEGAGEEAV